ncbi:MAG: pilus assembly protein TadG-related protein [Planctomycetota bacterium]
MRPVRLLAHDPGRRGGVVLIAALLALVLLASSVFFVFNVGTHLHRRIEAQHAADAAAIAGAGWVARSLNLVAMNNVESARLLAQVQVYDGLPSAIRNSKRDVDAAIEGVDKQLARGLPGHPWLNDALEEVRLDLVRQQVILEEMETALTQGYDVREMTTYELPNGGRGSMWEAIAALEQISLTAMREMGVTAQIAAHGAGQRNLSNAGGRAFLVPFVPTVPWRHGEPEDFIRPVTEGLLPADQDDEQWARGPFDAVFGLWRPTIEGNQFITPDYEVVEDYTVDTFRDGPPPLAEGEVIAYEVQSIFDFFVQQLRRAEAEAFDTDFTADGAGSWFGERAADTALGNMQQLEEQLRGADGDPTEVLGPLIWNSDWEEVRDIEVERGLDLPNMYVRLVFEPEAVDLDGDPLDGTLTLESWSLYPVRPAGLLYLGGGRDDTREMDTIDDDVEEVLRDARVLRIQPPGARARLVTQYTYTVWCGALESSQRERRFPNNFESVDDLPAPIALDLERLPHDADAEARRTYLYFFAAADQPAQASIWSGLFESGDAEAPDADGNTPTGVRRPWRRVAATASAEVFNNHSWDLWTQMWHAQLTPVEDLSGWLETMRTTGVVTEDLARLAELPDSFSDDVGATFNYLNRVAPLLDALREPQEPRSPILSQSQP